MAGPGKRAGGLVMLPWAMTVAANRPAVKRVDEYIFLKIIIRV
jgi:hypothetical protein